MKVTDKYVFFWDGIYSQWYEAPMTISGVTYNCCEQFMMHRKALLFNDTETAEKILATTNPREQKELGRQVKNFDANVWSKISYTTVFVGNYEKFTTNPDLLTAMLATGDKIFVEASPYDNIWGIGLHEDTVGIESPGTWRGTNLLGWALTQVKHEIKHALVKNFKV